MVDNNVGFCLGCLLWAVYIKSLGELQIEGNPCLGDTYNKEETVEEADYSINFFEKLKKMQNITSMKIMKSIRFL